MASAPESPAAANGFEKEAIKALADRVRGHVNSQPLRFPNQHWVRGAYYAGLMWQSPGQEARQRRSAPGSRQMAGRENGSLFGQPIPIRRPDHRVAHEPEMLVVLIIRNDEDDIRLLARSGLNRRPRLADED